MSHVGFGHAVRCPWMVGVLGNRDACVIARNCPMKTSGIRHTIHNHTRAIFRAYDVHSRVQLLALAPQVK